MIRFIAVLLVSGFIFLIASIAGAIPSDTQYSVTYDPIGETMSLINYSSSTVDLEFWSRIGPYAFQPLYLPPGDSATINAFGNIAATGLGSGDPTNTKTQYKVYSVTGPATVKYGYNAATKTYDSSSTVAAGETQDFDGPLQVITGAATPCSVKGCDFTLGGSTIADFGTGLPGWPGDPGDVCVDLEQGTIQSIDDSENATSIFTVLGGTECVPEPCSTLPLLGIGTLCLLAYDWRLRKAKA
jgi:hypothetical protein